MVSARALVALVLIGLLAPLAGLTSASPDEAVNVKYYGTPSLNGAITEGEYPPAVFMTSNVKVYMSYDATFLYIAISVTDATADGVNDMFQLYMDPYYAKGPFPRTTDSMIQIARDGSRKYCWYSAGWTDAPGGWPTYIDARVMYTANSWVTEMKIPLNSPVLDIPAGMNRTLGYLLMVYDKTTLLFKSPAEADTIVPATWGMMFSTSWWGPIDMAAVGISYDAHEVIVGRNVTLTVVFRNAGPSPMSNIQVELTVNGAPLGTKQFLGTVGPGQTGSLTFRWPAGEGAFRFIATVSIVGGAYERDTRNNVAEITLTPSLLSLSVVAPAGVSVTVSGRTVESPGYAVSFELPWGPVSVSVPRIVDFPGVRLMFKRWTPTGVTSPSTSYNLTSSSTLTAQYESYFLCHFAFKDKANRELRGPTFKLRFPNGTTQEFVAPSYVWMPTGISRLVGVFVGNVNVLEANQTVVIESPLELTYYVNLRDIRLRVADIFGLPVSGAALSVTFLNGTTISTTTPSDGIVTITMVPQGRLNVTASFLSFDTQVQIDASGAPSLAEWRVTLTLSYAVLAVLVGIPAAVIVVVAAVLIRTKLKA